MHPLFVICPMLHVLRNSMYQEIIHSKESKFNEAVEHLKTELAKFRTGRAHPGLVEGILIESYGSKVPLKQIASINIPEARTLAIQPWDRTMLQPIESALRESDLGLNPMNDGALIRINLPQLTEESRKDLVKALNRTAEETRISIRNVREDILREVQQQEKAGEIGEDEKFKAKDAVQKLVDGYNEKIETLRHAKESEIMTV